MDMRFGVLMVLFMIIQVFWDDSLSWGTTCSVVRYNISEDPNQLYKCWQKHKVAIVSAVHPASYSGF
jgi:hypothetical protein